MTERREPPPPRYRAGESGDYSSVRINGRPRPQDRSLTIILTLLMLAVAGLSGFALTTISGDAKEGKAGVGNLTPRVEHLETGQATLIRGQETMLREIQGVRELLFTLPKDRIRKED